MAFELPKLKYSYDSLEPHIDSKTMEIHHGKHHAEADILELREEYQLKEEEKQNEQENKQINISIAKKRIKTKSYKSCD